jgi:uncharacterized protein (DUF58 family)
MNGDPTTSPTDDSPAARWAAGRLLADPRLPAYLVAGFGAFVAAITTGVYELAALGAPFVALAALGIVERQPVTVRGTVTLHATRVIEGDVVTGVIQLEWAGEAELEAVLSESGGVVPLAPVPAAWSRGGRGPVTLPFELRATTWGAHDVASVWVRGRRPGGLLVREQKFAAAQPLRVLPAPLRLDRLLEPAEPRAVAGAHSSRFRGHGTDFAELRPYQPGDRLRDLSWATSARLGEPWVTVHHSERTGTVLLLLDTIYSRETRSTEALTRAARAAWAVAQIHLNAQDRVGLLARGRTMAWLTPRTGRRARWLLLEELLAVGSATGDAWPRPRRGGRISVPADALIVGVSGLSADDFPRALLHYRRAGHTTVALVIDTSDLLSPTTHEAELAARRLWLAQREARRHELERGSVPTALVTDAHGAGPAVSALRRHMKALRGRRPEGVAR